jgi:hypothetical protein
MELAIVSVVAEFDVKIAEIVQQEDVFAFVAVSQNIARKIERVELLLKGKFVKISGLHKRRGLTGEISENLPA